MKYENTPSLLSRLSFFGLMVIATIGILSTQSVAQSLTESAEAEPDKISFDPFTKVQPPERLTLGSVRRRAPGCHKTTSEGLDLTAKTDLFSRNIESNSRTNSIVNPTQVSRDNRCASPGSSPFEFGISYTYMRAPDAVVENLHGYTASFFYNLNNNIGVGGEFIQVFGATEETLGTIRLDTSQQTSFYLFGPQFNLHPSNNITLFFTPSIGGVHTTTETMFGTIRDDFSRNGFAFGVGGGIKIEPTPKRWWGIGLAFRYLQSRREDEREDYLAAEFGGRFFIGDRKRGRPESLPNKPPTVELTGSSATIVVPCSQGTTSATCNPTSPTIQLNARGKDPDGDTLLYSYTTTAGRILGDGPTVTWDLTGVRPGTYTATVNVDDGCGAESFSTITVTVESCTGCR